jgi:hypothetical protein
MKLEVEGRPVVDNVAPTQVRSTIASLRSYGPSSFASLTDDKGNYLQVAGGGVTCMMERRDAVLARHFRAYQDKRSQVFADGSILAFGGGEIKLSSDEWFTSADVEETFLAFLAKTALPQRVKWRDITEVLQSSVDTR